MNLRIVSISIFIYGLLTGCSSDTEIRKYSLNRSLEAKLDSAKRLNKEIQLDFCNAVPFEWDSVIVVPPYALKNEFEKLSLKNSSHIKMEFPLLNDKRCILLFIKQGKIVGRSDVSRQLLDFNSLLKPSQSLGVIARYPDCGALTIKKNDRENVVLLELRAN